MNLRSEIDLTSPKEVINNSDLFEAWIVGSLTLRDVLKRCPSVLDDIMEEFNNDWIEAVEDECAEMGLDLTDDFEIVPPDAEFESDDDDEEDE